MSDERTMQGPLITVTNEDVVFDATNADVLTLTVTWEQIEGWKRAVNALAEAYQADSVTVTFNPPAREERAI
jgi:hypothetical protein